MWFITQFYDRKNKILYEKIIIYPMRSCYYTYGCLL